MQELIIGSGVNSYNVNNAWDGCNNLSHVVLKSTASNSNVSGLEFISSTLKTVGPIGGNYNVEYSWINFTSSYLIYSSSYEEVTLPSTTTQINSNAINGANVTKLYCYATVAPTLQNNAFGGTGNKGLGYNTKDSGINELHVPIGATGYDTGQWSTQLVDNLGFTLIYDL